MKKATVGSAPAEIKLEFRPFRQKAPLQKGLTERLIPIQSSMLRLTALSDKYLTLHRASGPIVSVVADIEKEQASSGLKSIDKIVAMRWQKKSPQLAKTAADELALSNLGSRGDEEKLNVRLDVLSFAKVVYAFCEALKQLGGEEETRAFLNWYSGAEESGIFDLNKDWHNPQLLQNACKSNIARLEKEKRLGEIAEDVKYSLGYFPGVSFLA